MSEQLACMPLDDYTGACDALRTRLGTSDKIKSGDLKPLIESIPSGVELPELTNPASDEEVFKDKEYIDDTGAKRTGTFTIDEELAENEDLINQIQEVLATKSSVSLPTLTNPGNSYKLVEGYQLIDQEGNVVEGEISECSCEDIYIDGNQITVSPGIYSDDTRVQVDEVELAAPSISVDENGLVTATVSQSAGYVQEGSTSKDYQLPTQGATTITPSTEEQVAVYAGTYVTEDVKVAATESGGSGSSTGTCTVTMITPAGMLVIGYGECNIYLSTDYGVSFTIDQGSVSMPSTRGSSHYLPMFAKRVFTNLPIGSIFTFYSGASIYITGASISGDIEFSLVNTSSAASNQYMYAVCKCNGDGEITINT